MSLLLFICSNLHILCNNLSIVSSILLQKGILLKEFKTSLLLTSNLSILFFNWWYIFTNCGFPGGSDGKYLPAMLETLCYKVTLIKAFVLFTFGLFFHKFSLLLTYFEFWICKTLTCFQACSYKKGILRRGQFSFFSLLLSLIPCL